MNKADRIAEIQKKLDAGNTAAAVAATVTPTAPPPVPVPVDPPKKSASDFATAARREKDLRDKVVKAQNEMAAREQALKQREAQLSDLEGLRASAKKNPQAWLKAAGLSYDEITQDVLSGGKLTPEDVLKQADAKIEAYKQEQEQKLRQMVEQEQKQIQTQRDQALAKFRADCNAFPESSTKHELLKAFPASGGLMYELVATDVQQQVAEGKQPVAMTMEAAADRIEEWLEEHVSDMAKLEKIQKRLGAAPVTNPVIPPVVTENSRPRVTTITNNMTASQPVRSPNQRETKAEKVKRIQAMVDGGKIK